MGTTYEKLEKEEGEADDGGWRSCNPRCLAAAAAAAPVHRPPQGHHVMNLRGRRNRIPSRPRAKNALRAELDGRHHQGMSTAYSRPP